MSSGTPTATAEATPPATAADVTPPAPGKTARRRLFDVGVVTGVIALRFTATTYWVDRQGQDRADDRQARAELTDMVGRMAALPREYGLLNGASSDVDVNAVSSNFNSELLVLVSQAERLVDQHPSIASPTDWLSIGFAHYTLSNFDQAIDAFREAREHVVSKSDARVATAAKMDEAAALFGLGRFAAGRAMFERAIDDMRRGPGIQADYDVDFIRRRWAQNEIGVGRCDNAARQIQQMALPGNRDDAFAEYSQFCTTSGGVAAGS